MCNKEFHPDDDWVDKNRLLESKISEIRLRMAEAAVNLEAEIIQSREAFIKVGDSFRGSINTINIFKASIDDIRIEHSTYRNRAPKYYDKFLPKPIGQQRRKKHDKLRLYLR